MSKQNFLFILLGILAGFVGGFTFANSVNRSETASIAQAQAATTQVAGANLPAGGAHPSVGVTTGEGQGAMSADVQAVIEHAKQEPNKFEAQTEAANMYYMIQRYEPALGYLQRAHALRPDAYEVITRLGNVNFYLERYDEASLWYEKALAMRPDDTGVRSDLGLTFYLRSDLERAISEYKKSLELDPKHEETLQNLTVALRDKKNTAEAKQTLARLEAAHPQNESIARLRESLSRD